MARKVKVRGIDEAIDELFKDYKRSLMKAMKEASEQAKEEINRKARSCLHEYYWNFQSSTHEPNIYERTGSLENAFIPYMRVGAFKNRPYIRADVGMGYWPLMLDGVYSGSNQWTPVDGEWVLENYLNGIHPTTDGSYYIGAPYLPVQDKESPNQKMGEYLEEYVKTFHDNVLLSFAHQITRR